MDTVVYSDIDLSTGKIEALPDITENVFVLESSLSHSDEVFNKHVMTVEIVLESSLNHSDEVFNKHVMTVENTRNLYQDQLWDCQELKISIILLHKTCMSWDQIFDIFI